VDSNSRRHRGSNRGCRWAIPDTQEIVSPRATAVQAGRKVSFVLAQSGGRFFCPRPSSAVPRARLPLVGLWPTFPPMYTVATHPSPGTSSHRSESPVGSDSSLTGGNGGRCPVMTYSHSSDSPSQIVPLLSHPVPPQSLRAHGSTRKPCHIVPL
jgi:hypothetical protein